MFNRLKPKSEFSRNVLTLMTGTTIAQAIPIAISPILTRIYTPEDFGIFALYMSVASIVSVMATGRYELAIMLPKKDEDAINIVALSIMISFLVSFIVFLIVFFFNSAITNLLGNPKISSWLYFIPLSVLFTGLYQSFNYWSNRKKEYKNLATSRVIRSGTTATSNLVFGFSGLGRGGLIGSSLLGQGVASFVLGKMILDENKNKFKNIKYLKILALIKRYINFPKYNTQHALINIFFSQMPILILSKYFTASSVGFYALATRVIQTPVSVLSSAVSSTLYQKIVNLKNNKQKYMNHIYRFLKVQFLLSIILFSFLYFISYHMDTILGEKWKEVGVYIQLILPWLFMVFLVSPLAFSMNMTDNQKAGLGIEWIYGAVKFFSLMIGVFYFKDIEITLGLFSISCAVFLIFQGIWFINLLKKDEV